MYWKTSKAVNCECIPGQEIALFQVQATLQAALQLGPCETVDSTVIGGITVGQSSMWVVQKAPVKESQCRPHTHVKGHATCSGKFYTSIPVILWGPGSDAVPDMGCQVTVFRD